MIPFPAIGRLTLVEALYSRWRWGSYYRAAGAGVDRETHLSEAAAWLCRAQDAGEDRGFARSVRFGGDFGPSYPETTGYIIPTLFALERFYENPLYRRRAIEAADWEVEIQMDSGAVMAGTMGKPPTPAVFNTGQVLLGWTAVGRETGEVRYREAARRACDWMLANQEPDGRWVKGNSRFAKADATVYNVKAAWGMCEAGALWGWSDAVDGAIRNAEYCLTNQRANGWFANCCLNDPERPLLHTIAYSVQGLLGIGEATQRRDLLDAARLTSDALLERLAPDGFLAGRWTADWKRAVPWCCLTGTAQMSNAWGRLYELFGDEHYRRGCVLANDYLTSRHDVVNPDLRVRGGVPGSWPTWGDYGRFSVLNWATKFFIDALMLERRILANTDRNARAV